jgi:hypothetical protein
MARIRVNTYSGGGTKRIRITSTAKNVGQFSGQEFVAYKDPSKLVADWWRVDIDNGQTLCFTDAEVRVLGRHEGEYNPNHWGELDPDAYDRMAWKSVAFSSWADSAMVDYAHGRHLLHTGVE